MLAGSLIGLPFLLIGVWGLVVAVARRRDLGRRTVQLLACVARDRLEASPHMEEDFPDEVQLVARVRGAQDQRQRLLAYDELVGRQELDVARLRLEKAGLTRLSAFTFGAGAIFELAFGAPPQAVWCAVSFLLFGLAAGGYVARLAAARQRDIGARRAALLGLRRELFGFQTSSFSQPNVQLAEELSS